MLMLNNRLCLTSVVEFLRRGRVDRGTGGGKGVVVVDSSKRKVSRFLFLYIASMCRNQGAMCFSTDWKIVSSRV